jgi:Pilus formation protein N terminal region
MTRKITACGQIAAVCAGVFAGAISATQAQIVVKSVSDPQFSEGVADEGGPEGQGLRAAREDQVNVSPGGLRRLELSGRMESVVVGDPHIVDVLPTTDNVIFLLGKQVGITDIAILGEKGRVLSHYTVSVNPTPPPRYREVEIYNGKELTNYTSYTCDTVFHGVCAEPDYHTIRKEDLPKGYNASTFQDQTPPAGNAGGGGNQPRTPPQLTYPVNR